VNNKNIKILALGDVVGRPGRQALTSELLKLKKEYNADFVIVNGENSAGGSGIDEKCANEIKAAGADLITLGDHTWQKNEVKDFLDRNSSWCIRPANYPPGAPGKGYSIIKCGDLNVGVLNLMGRVFISQFLDCPFRKADELLNGELGKADIIICDMHAEATSEKKAMGKYLDGRVALVFGTHTHVQTADEEILPKGTAYITDIGMCGPADSILGMKNDISINRFVTGMKFSYELGMGEADINGIYCEIDSLSKKASLIKRIQIKGKNI